MTTNTLTTTLPLNASDVAIMQREAEADRAVYTDLAVSDADEYEFVDALLSEVKRRAKTATDMRSSATKPLYQVIKTVESWFAPVLKELATAELACKGAMSRYQSARLATEREARELAAVAAETGNAEELITALTVAAEASKKPDARASVTWTWTLKRVVPDLVLASWLVPDVARAEAHAKSAGNAEEIEPVPGFIFERVARIGGRK